MTIQSEKFELLAQECVKTSTDAVETAEKFLSALKQAKSDREGISLLDVKNREILAYISELALLMDKMSCGRSIANEPSVLRAAKHRTVIEKLRPIEVKMKAQIDKLIQVQLDGSDQKSGPMRARPDQMELDDSSDDGSNDGSGDEQGEKKTKKYVPPKMMAVQYDEEEEGNPNGKMNKAIEKARHRALQSSLIQELKEQYSEAPEVYTEVSKRKHQIDKEREAYEEDNFMRLRVNRAQRIREEKMTRDNAMDDLLKFGNYMMRGEDGEALRKTKRKSTSAGGPGGKKSRLSSRENKKIKDGKLKQKRKNIKRRQ